MWSSWVRNQTQAKVVNYYSNARSFNSLCWAGDQICVLAMERLIDPDAPQQEFLLTFLNCESSLCPWLSFPLAPPLPSFPPHQGALQDFSLVDSHAFLAPFSFYDFISFHDFHFSPEWVIHLIISKPGMASGRGVSMSLLDSTTFICFLFSLPPWGLLFLCRAWPSCDLKFPSNLIYSLL